MPPDALHKQLARNIKAIAARRRMPIYKLADLAGVGRSSLARMLGGEQSPTVRMLAKLAAPLGVTVLDLLIGDEAENIRLTKSSTTRIKKSMRTSVGINPPVGRPVKGTKRQPLTVISAKVDPPTLAALQKLEAAVGEDPSITTRRPVAIRRAILLAAAELERAKR